MNCKISVKIENLDKINELIKKAEGKSRVRTITYTNIKEVCDMIEKKYSNYMSKKTMKDMIAYVDLYAQSFPNTYKGLPMSTQFEVIKTDRGWNIIDISRKEVRTRNEILLQFTENQKNCIINHMSKLDKWGYNE